MKHISLVRTLFHGLDGNAFVVGIPPHLDIREALLHSESIHLATAYGHLSGWNLLKESILGSRGKVFLLAGCDHNFTEPELLADWLIASKKRTVQARIFNKQDRYFHPKVLILNAQSTNLKKLPIAIVGSGNLSAGGLLKNVECALFTDRLELVAEIACWFSTLFNDGIPITADFIALYRPLYEKAVRNRERERRSAKRLNERIDGVRKAQIESKTKEVAAGERAFHVVNTNMRYDPEAHHHMLNEGQACAYEEGWKEKIRRIQEGDIVFLYESFGPGIVAFGTANGKAKEDSSENSCCIKLEEFRRICPPISAREITSMNRSQVTFGQVWQRPRLELALKLYEEALRRSL